MLFRNPGRALRALAAAGLFSLSLSLSVSAPASALTVLNPLLPPSENFDLTHWYLTLPSALTVDPTTLSNGYTLTRTFYTDLLSGGMVFRCPNLAGTTTNTHYSRTELREMLTPTGDASDDANNWTPATGGRLKARLK